jgi:hypothetical protein
MLQHLRKNLGRLFRPHADSRWRHLPWPLVGIAAGLLLEFWKRTSPDTSGNPTLGSIASGYIPGAFVGGIIGYLLELMRDATRVAGQLAELQDGFLGYLRRAFEQHPYKLLVDAAPPFTGVVGTLLRKSLKEGYNHIANVREHQYLEHLQEALASSDTYFGIQRHPVSWFFSPAGAMNAPIDIPPRETDDSRARYLSALRNRAMKKVRVFVISAEEEQAMRVDVSNDALMARYWAETGRDVESFWITEQQLQTHQLWPGRLTNSVTFNGVLIIRYDERREVLEFDVLDGSEPENGIRALLDEQLRTGAREPFAVLDPPTIPAPAVRDSLDAYPRKLDAYDDLPTMLPPGPVRQIDLLQFSGQTAVSLLGKLARKYPEAAIRLALLHPTEADKFASPHDRGSEGARIRATLVTVRAIRKDRRADFHSAAAGDVEVRYYTTLPSVSSVLVDDAVANVSWYRQFHDPGVAAPELRGHDCPAITAMGASVAKLRNIGREQFDRVWATATPVPLDETPGAQPAVVPEKS